MIVLSRGGRGDQGDTGDGGTPHNQPVQPDGVPIHPAPAYHCPGKVLGLTLCLGEQLPRLEGFELQRVGANAWPARLAFEERALTLQHLLPIIWCPAPHQGACPQVRPASCVLVSACPLPGCLHTCVALVT